MVQAYLVLKWLHVLSAAYLVGSFVTEWALRAYARRAGDRGARAFVWDFHVKGEEKVAIPFGVVLLVSGLLMVFGPAAGGWSFGNDLWIGAGLAIFVAILVLMVAFATASAKAAHAAYKDGAGETAAAPHERRYGLLAGVSALLVVAAVWLMVAKPF